MKNKGQPSVGLYTVGIAALFLLGFFLLVIFGAKSYRDAVAGQQNNMQTRAMLSYIASCVKSNDAEGAVAVLNSDYGPVLVISEGATGYAQRIYCHDGRMVEDFAMADAALTPESAQIIGETALFEIEQRPGGILTVRTDSGRVLLHLRSEGGWAA